MPFKSQPYTGNFYGRPADGVNPNLTVFATFKNGKIDGNFVAWWTKNGQKAISTTYINGKQNGINTFWANNGAKMSEATYKDDKENGIETVYYPTGQKMWVAIFVDDDIRKKTWWYDNGKKLSEETYKNDKLNGVRTSWNENGDKTTETYVDGELVK